MTQTDHKIQRDSAMDAQVVDEQPGQPKVDAPIPHEGLALAVLLLVLCVGVFALAQNSAAIMAPDRVKTQENSELAVFRTPVLVVLPPASTMELAPARPQGKRLASFSGVVSSAKVIRQQAGGLSGNFNDSAAIPPVGSRLTPESYTLMLEYLARKEGITLEADARDVLLRAGYTLPPGTANATQSKATDHVSFVRDVARELVKDEVESFLHKLNVVTKVGVYVAEQKE